MDPTVKALITIVDRGKGEGISAFLNRKYNQASFLAMGGGTAGSDIMAMLGLDNVDKDVVLSLVSAADLPDMLGDIAGRRFIRTAGKGIAFTLPLSGIGALFEAALTQRMEKDPEKEDAPMEQEMPIAAPPAEPAAKEAQPPRSDPYRSEGLSLVLAIANPGYTDAIMEHAKAAGATGGTVIYARGVGHDGASRFLGITLQADKEIVAILTPAEQRLPIMQAVNQGFGLRAEAKAIVFSLPVEDFVQVT